MVELCYTRRKVWEAVVAKRIAIEDKSKRIAIEDKSVG